MTHLALPDVSAATAQRYRVFVSGTQSMEKRGPRIEIRKEKAGLQIILGTSHEYYHSLVQFVP